MEEELHLSPRQRTNLETILEQARIGLGLSEAVFSSNGDADQIHQVLLEKFPVLGVMWQLHTSASCREFPQHGGDRRAR